MKIQPIDSFVPAGNDPAKPVAKSRFKRLFERQFPSVLRISSTDKLAGAGGDQNSGKEGGSGSDSEPSSVCLANLVQNFIEESNEKPAAKCGRNRCNCFNGNCTESSDEDLEFSGGKTDSPIAAEVLKNLVPCASATERNLLADTAKIVEKSKVGKRKEDRRKIVTEGLTLVGYDASICKSRWEKSASFPAGEYEYIDVIVDGERVLIDVDFKSEFKIARSTKNYRAVLLSLPSIFVGKSDRLQQIVAIVSEAAKQSLKKKGLHLPPWRKTDYMRAKWLSPYQRVTTKATDGDANQSENETCLITTGNFAGEFKLCFGEQKSEFGDFVPAPAENSSQGGEGKITVVVSPWQPPAIKPKVPQQGAKIRGKKMKQDRGRDPPVKNPVVERVRDSSMIERNYNRQGPSGPYPPFNHSRVDPPPHRGVPRTLQKRHPVVRLKNKKNGGEERELKSVTATGVKKGGLKSFPLPGLVFDKCCKSCVPKESYWPPTPQLDSGLRVIELKLQSQLVIARSIRRTRVKTQEFGKLLGKGPHLCGEVCVDNVGIDRYVGAGGHRPAPGAVAVEHSFITTTVNVLGGESLKTKLKPCKFRKGWVLTVAAVLVDPVLGQRKMQLHGNCRAIRLVFAFFNLNRIRQKFIDAALQISGLHALSYIHHGQKGVIRDHLLSLLADFPSLSPSADHFVHNDGTSVHLLNVTGSLRLPGNRHPIRLTIWVHQLYPIERPLVFLNTGPTQFLLRDHPFVDTSGAATSPYLQTWRYPNSNLSDLTRNLLHIFTHYPPFSEPLSLLSNQTRPSLPSKRESIDRLAGILHRDLTSLQTRVENETEDLIHLQKTLKKRARITSTIIYELQGENSSVKQRVNQVLEQVDLLQNWLRINASGFTSSLAQDACDMFEAEDDDSRQILENEAADLAIEDVIEVMDKEAENGSVPCGAYIKQIRALAREQFFHRAMIVKLQLQNSESLYPP
ncbi:hypothetical protein H6P81_004795 [Aristolochia fimbriata]|uniref:Uncharacterized protein n=1 Tax=Aristolochia fimbriata TaxID=158543 RepID=A0AAV7EW78_ARIFI|nr:hypothetical protein H6P81_004795 [Aristolochia fimbriata]